MKDDLLKRQKKGDSDEREKGVRQHRGVERRILIKETEKRGGRYRKGRERKE